MRKGQVDKFLTLIDGHTALYSCHVVSGMQGPMSVGHHALLKFPLGAAGRISTSRFEHGQVLPSAFESPEGGGYQSLRPGAVFRSLERVPLQDGSHADLTAFPARAGYDDLVLVAAPARLPLAWSAVTFSQPPYVWFALRDPRSLRSTLLWMSNGGRHYPPWNGEHTRVLGIEDVTANLRTMASRSRHEATPFAGEASPPPSVGPGPADHDSLHHGGDRDPVRVRSGRRHSAAWRRRRARGVERVGVPGPASTWSSSTPGRASW